MKKKRILFVVGLYLLVVGSIVYISFSLPKESTEQVQSDQENELGLAKQEEQVEDNHLIYQQDDSGDLYLQEDERNPNEDSLNHQKSDDPNDINFSDKSHEGQKKNSSRDSNSAGGISTDEKPSTSKRPQEQKQEDGSSNGKKEQDNQNEKGNEEQMTNKGTVLSSLGTAYEIQDNTVVDRWGVIIKLDRLPEELKSAKSFTVSIGDQAYELRLNKYNSNVYNTQVSSIEHTKDQVEQAILTTN